MSTHCISLQLAFGERIAAPAPVNGATLLSGFITIRHASDTIHHPCGGWAGGVRFEQGILGLAEVGEGAKQAEKAQDGHRRTVRFIGRWETGLDLVGSPLAHRQTPRSFARKLISDCSRVSKPSFRIAYDSLGGRQPAEGL
jgi:hypothetical protein